jgi:hypothetical protein
MARPAATASHATAWLPLLIALALALTACGNGGHETIDRLDCNTCHAAEYDAASVHAEQGFPRTCYACHGLSDWTEADENHDRFSIDRGSHTGFDCSACHLSQDNRNQITCISCHWHSEARTSPWHVGNGDYEYAPAACLNCHGGRR